MPHNFVKTSLIVAPIVVFVILFVWNIKDYMGVYEDLIQLVLLATGAVYVPSLIEGKKPLAYKWAALISAGICIVSLGLFLLTKPTYTTQQAAQTLLNEGYTSIAVGDNNHTERITEGGNFFVSKGYVYICRKDVKGEESDNVLFNPLTGEWSILENSEEG